LLSLQRPWSPCSCLSLAFFAATRKEKFQEASQRRLVREERFLLYAQDMHLTQDACSEASTKGTTVSAVPALTLDEEREARKIEKKLREIAALEVKEAEGHILDKLQLEKISKKDDLLDSLVMKKLHAGYGRHARKSEDV
jgi:hypothetical protein